MSDTTEAHEFTRTRVAALVESKLAEALGQEADALVKFFRELTKLENVVEGWCTECGGRARIRHPDYKGARALLDLWLGYVVGKPTERVEVQSSVTLRGGISKEQFSEQLKAMSTAELEAIAEGRVPWPFNGAGERPEADGD